MGLIIRDIFSRCILKCSFILDIEVCSDYEVLFTDGSADCPGVCLATRACEAICFLLG